MNQWGFSRGVWLVSCQTFLFCPWNRNFQNFRIILPQNSAGRNQAGWCQQRWCMQSCTIRQSHEYGIYNWIGYQPTVVVWPYMLPPFIEGQQYRQMRLRRAYLDLFTFADPDLQARINRIGHDMNMKMKVTWDSSDPRLQAWKHICLISSAGTLIKTHATLDYENSQTSLRKLILDKLDTLSGSVFSKHDPTRPTSLKYAGLLNAFQNFESVLWNLSTNHCPHYIDVNLLLSGVWRSYFTQVQHNSVVQTADFCTWRIMRVRCYCWFMRVNSTVSTAFTSSVLCEKRLTSLLYKKTCCWLYKHCKNQVLNATLHLWCVLQSGMSNSDVKQDMQTFFDLGQ